jgi:hypothetical protein
MDTAALRAKYRPDDVRVLFVGESPPAGGTFFYAADSKLYVATRAAFETGVPELLVDAQFLDDFKALGCFLDDLCLEPINHLKGTRALVQQRHDSRDSGERPLARRIRQTAPLAVVVAMKGIESHVRSAMDASRVTIRSTRAFAFPARPEHVKSYISELSQYLVELRDLGILRRS